jgi:hypothetical protein
MTSVLPKEINYDIPVSLPAGVQTFDINVTPCNGSVFSTSTAGAFVQFDLPARSGFLDPKTLSLRYRYAISSNGVTRIKGTPFYTPILRLETIFGSQPVQTVNEYGQLMNMLTNVTHNVADKIGTVTGLGFKLEDTAAGAQNAMTLSGTDGRACAASETGTFFGPLRGCILSEADRYIPTGMMPNIRIQLTLDSIANIFSANQIPVTLDLEKGLPTCSNTVIPGIFDLSDFVLSYSLVDFGPDVDNVVRAMGDKLTIKSQSFNSSANPIAQGFSGQTELIYSQKMASVKSLFLHCSSNSVNTKYDAYEILGGGDLQFTIASRNYPQSRPLSSSVAHRGTLLLELKKAVGCLYDEKSGMSINTQEFLTLGTASSITNPAKVYYGVNTEQLQSNSVLLSGVSTQNTPITARLNISTALAAPVLATLISAFDVLIEVSPAEKSARVIQ